MDRCISTDFTGLHMNAQYSFLLLPCITFLYMSMDIHIQEFALRFP